MSVLPLRYPILPSFGQQGMNIHSEARKQRYEANPGKVLWGDDGHSWRVVLSMLRMFRMLQRSYRELTPAEREGINPHAIRFNGFAPFTSPSAWRLGSAQ